MSLTSAVTFSNAQDPSDARVILFGESHETASHQKIFSNFLNASADPARDIILVEEPAGCSRFSITGPLNRIEINGKYRYLGHQLHHFKNLRGWDHPDSGAWKQETENKISTLCSRALPKFLEDPYQEFPDKKMLINIFDNCAQEDGEKIDNVASALLQQGSLKPELKDKYAKRLEKTAALYKNYANEKKIRKYLVEKEIKETYPKHQKALIKNIEKALKETDGKVIVYCGYGHADLSNPLSSEQNKQLQHLLEKDLYAVVDLSQLAPPLEDRLASAY